MIDVGTVIADRYELQERLGVGGMGEVYRAYDRRFRLDVAIKALLPHVSRDEQLVERFLREGRTLALLRHPGIIGIFDMLHVDGRDFLVLEFVPGHSLEDELRSGRLPWTRCADIGSQVCGALAAAHARDVVHRDIKPSNILLEPSGVVRVADFGIARLATNVSSVTRAGMSMGTPGFWAPEQALGEKSTPRTDIYSLGAVLFLAGTGRLPFVAEEEGPAAAYINVTRPVPDPREVAPDLPPAAAELIMQALAKDPAERFPSAIEMAQALRVSAGLPPVPVTPFETPTHSGGVVEQAPTERDLREPATEREATAGEAPVVPPTIHTGPRADAPGAPETEVAPAEAAAETEAAATEAEAEAEAPPPEAEAPEAGAPDTEVAEPGAPETEVGPRGAPETAIGARAPDPATAPKAPRRPQGPGGAAPAAGRRPSRGVLVGGAVALLAAAVVGGLAAGGAFSGGGSEPVATTTVPAGNAEVQLPADWPSASGGGSIPGLDLAAATTASPDRASGEEMAVGRTDARGATLLPERFRSGLAADPEPQRVQLGRNEAYLYQDLSVEGFDGSVSVFAMPTNRGVTTIACAAPADRADDFIPRCEAAATTLRLTDDTTAFPLGPSARYAEALSGALTTLDERRTALRQQLANADTPDAQQQAAQRLSTAFGSAAGALRDQSLGPEGAGLNEAVLAGLRAQARAYDAMATAAGEDDASAFGAATQAVRDGEAQLAAALTDLEAAGYSIAS